MSEYGNVESEEPPVSANAAEMLLVVSSAHCPGCMDVARLPNAVSASKGEVSAVNRMTTVIASFTDSPPWKGGVAAPVKNGPVPKRRGRGGRSQVTLWERVFNIVFERPPRLRLSKVASQHFIDGAATPPLQGGECNRNLRRVLRFYTLGGVW